VKDTQVRSILKTVAWRLIATTTTMIVAYVFTGEVILAVEIGSVEAIAKIVLFYVHERVWERVRWGRRPIHSIPVKGELTEDELNNVEEKLQDMGYL